MRFYCEELGFEVEAHFPDPPYAIVKKGMVRLSLAEIGHDLPDLPSHHLVVGATAQSSTVVVILEVPDIVDAHQRFTSAGVDMASALWEAPWGGGRFFVTDPDGYLVEIEQLG